MLNVIIDVIVIALLWFFVIKGIKKGLVKSILELLTGIVSYIIAFMFYEPVAQYLMQFKFFENINNSIKETFMEKMLSPTENFTELPKWLGDMATSSVENAGTVVADNVSRVVINVIAVVLVYIVIRIVLMAFNFLFDRIKIFKIGELNAFGGACFGFINAAVVLYVAMMIVFIMIMSDPGSELNEIIQSTYIAKWFYNNNVLTDLIFN